MDSSDSSMRRIIQNDEIHIDKVCSTLWSQARGLMFSKPKTLLFCFKTQRRVLIHNWFVFFPIDLIFLDQNKRIVETKRELSPFSWYKSRELASFLIEKPSIKNETKSEINKIEGNNKGRRNNRRERNDRRERKIT